MNKTLDQQTFHSNPPYSHVLKRQGMIIIESSHSRKSLFCYNFNEDNFYIKSLFSL